MNNYILAKGKFHKFEPDEDTPEGDWEWFDSNVWCDECIPSVIISEDYFKHLLENQK